MTLALNSTISKLLAYCRAEDWSGYDPYDALNSRVFEAVPLLNSRIPRIAFTQLLKRSPVNVRGIVGIPKTQNSKALALFLSAFLQLTDKELPDREQLIRSMSERLAHLRSGDTRFWCWGYNFPWQGRKVVVPNGAPNLVCTTFVANAVLDLYEQHSEPQWLEMAVSSAEYLLAELYWANEGAAGFSYPLPKLTNQIYNANFLAAALLSRVYRHTGLEKFVEPALRAARFSASQQQQDGSWFYGEAESQRWIDNFHTGYNLGALRCVSRNLGTSEFDECMLRGFNFYRAHFFREDNATRYFHNRTYPIDIHCVAQSILTLLAFKDLEGSNEALANSVALWAMKHMWDERGFFYYRVLRTCTIRIPYMRWSQAWMMLALSTLFRESTAREESLAVQESDGLVTA